jgi:predicted AAA+ superfamily ATPase
VINYISYLEDAFLLFSVSHYDASLKKQINKPKKLYCIDPGMINAVSFSFSENFGRLYENIVFVQLLRSGYEIYYWQDKKGMEVDFVLRSGLSPVRLIQVSTDISDPDTKNREVNGLISAMENFGIDEGTVITSDNFGTETVSGRIIHYVPLWYWLILEESEGASTL